ncbi:Uncharacterised protein [Yersinia intermedia]|uniref:hypothetical protein n=1 Tax=Yersinia intermedia TaxID=631 RepID=UPI0005DF4455|nr:hypothetical protein [Yersinia intermedia]CNH17441.1 Uncharacterised protein [Yersinia intermedia]
MNVETFIDTCNKIFNTSESVEHNDVGGYEEVYKKARLLISDRKQVLTITKYLMQKIIILHHERNFNYLKYKPVLESINEAVRIELDNTAPTPTITNWEELISLIIENKKELFYFDSGLADYNENKFHNFAHSYIRLGILGVDFLEKDFKFFISENSFEFINGEIERIAHEYGGDALLNIIFEKLGHTYNPITGRFMEYRHVSMGVEYINPAIPFGYLIAIASKYAGGHGTNSPQLFDKLLCLISDIIVVYEIQPYSQWEAIHLRDSALIRFLQENVLYDNLVGITQIASSHAVSLIKHLQSEFCEPTHISCGIKLKELTRVVLALISFTSNKKPCMINFKEISKKAKTPEFKVKIIFDKFLSFPCGKINSDLRFPPASTDIDYFFKPVMKMAGKYKTYPKSIASLACLNTVCHFISYPNGIWKNNIDSKLGYAIENFLRSEFVKKGIKIAHGERVDGDVDLEVDLLCETNDEIYIFEMKKKGLTRQAQSGDEGNILKDLADSVLASHCQAMRIENVLKNCESLHLVYDGVKRSINLNGRRVLRISVSLPDFGALQDKIILQKILATAVRNNISSHDSTADEKLKNWRIYSEELKKLALENGELEPDRMPFHNSLFMSIPQILMVLDKSDNADEFFKYLKMFISATTGSRDVYTEFLYHLQLFNYSKTNDLSTF